MIAPAFPTTAIPHEYPAKLGLIAVETALYNVLDYPAGIVPVTKVIKDDIENLNNETIFSTGWNLTKLDMKKASQDTENLPVGVQIITQPFEEEKCLAIMKQVQEIVGKIY
uniref:Amidase domain-containing protein n=1 Tax=Panagrolaimus sp. JU765 TaxID=591449 RepID=A0AC34RFN3_9BILA